MKKKLILMTGILSLVLINAAACGRSSNTSVGETASVHSDSGTGSAESVIPAEVQSGQESASDDATDEDVFHGNIVDGGFILEKCTSSDKDIVVPDTIQGAPVVKIGKNAFAQLQCEKITLPSSVREIDDEAFFECSQMKEIELGDGLQTIGKYAFIYCSSLETVEFPSSLQTIESVLFHECGSLTEVYIPASVTEIPEGLAFMDTCPNLVIFTEFGSAAQKAAMEAGIPYMISK